MRIIIITADSFLALKRTVNYMRGGMGSEKGFAVLSSEPWVNAEACGSLRELPWETVAIYLPPTFTPMPFSIVERSKG